MITSKDSRFELKAAKKKTENPQSTVRDLVIVAVKLIMVAVKLILSVRVNTKRIMKKLNIEELTSEKIEKKTFSNSEDKKEG